MKRRLVWACGGLVALGAAVAALWPEPASHVDPTHAGAPVLAAPSTPASLPSPPVEPAAQVGTPVRAEIAPAGAGAIEERRAEHELTVEQHRSEVRERATRKREQLEQKRAHLRAERAAFLSRRAPDPDRPPPETLELGPRVHDPQKNAQ